MAMADKKSTQVVLNTWIEIVVIVSMVANVLSLLSFIATSWAVPADIAHPEDYEGLGLWRFCVREFTDGNHESHKLVCTDLVSSSKPAWFAGVQATSALGFVSGILAFSCVLLYACANACHESRVCLLCYLAFNYLSVLLYFITLIVFGVLVGDSTINTTSGFKLSWCFILNCISSVLTAAVGLLMLFEYFSLFRVPYGVQEDDYHPALDNGVAAVDTIPDNIDIQLDMQAVNAKQFAMDNNQTVA